VRILPGNWNVNEHGANEIAVMRKKLDVKAAVAEASYNRLLGASVEYGEDLGIYQDVLQAELKVIDTLAKECRLCVDALTVRLLEYETLIREEVKKAKIAAEEAAGNNGGQKHAR
jgi:hypothetical protein